MINVHIISEHREFQYKTDFIPQVGESIYCPHFGTFKVEKVTHYVSDDRMEDNELMWIDIYVNKESF